MATEALLLGLVGHGTTGTDGIEAGIHLRWQFQPDLGFPRGGFRLYRRPSASGPAAICFNFQSAALGAPPPYLTLAGSDDRLYLDQQSGTLRVVDHQIGRVLEMNTSAGLRLRLPKAGHEVSLRVELVRSGRITCRAFAGGVEVAGNAAPTGVLGQWTLAVQAPVIEDVVVVASRVSIIEVCYRPVESCDDPDAWEQDGGPICLPVFYPGRPCEGSNTPDCDELEITGRLPKDPCERLKYVGHVVEDLVESLRVVVEPDLELPQAERIVPGEAAADDCPAPGEPAPKVEMPVVDALLTAALDPTLARILGLYHVDQPPAGTYDYKVSGDWPVGALWRLPRSLTFDDVKPGRRLLNAFSVGPLRFLARTRPTIINRPNPKLRTRRAIAFLETDSFDWNLPAHPSLSRPAEDHALVIWFPYNLWFPDDAVSEVQVYVGQESPNVQLQAFDADPENPFSPRPISEKIAATRNNAVLAVHGAAPADRIRFVVLSGSRFWIYRVAWGSDRIAHGTHCGFAYGLSVRDVPRPAKPTGVAGYALPGLVQKAADCEPLRTGATKDARLNIGVNWYAPEDRTQLPGDVPVRYDVIRINAGGREEPASEDGPVLVGLPPDGEPPPYRPPPGWPSTQLKFTDTALEPGTYRYRVVGIDIFGRRSVPSDPSAPVTPEPPPPPTPTVLDARFLDRSDPRLLDADRALLPADVEEAVRIRWQWPEEAQRAAPDAAAFRVHYAPGVPNVLEGTVESVVPDGTLATVKVLLEGVAEAPAQLFAGRQVAQGRRTFRILSHPAGMAAGTAMRIDLQVRLPAAPSTGRPTEGPCTVALEATIPVEVRSFVGSGVSVNLRTTALAAAPSSGLVGSEVRLDGERISLATIEEPVFTAAQSEWRSSCTVPAGADRESILAVVPPVFVPLQLPPPATPAYRDYVSPAGWPFQFGVVLPRTTSGDFELLVRKPSGGEATGLTQPTPGTYVLVVDALPAGLDVSLNVPQRQMAFGVSCVGPPALESAVSRPAILTRVYRASEAELAAAANLPLEPLPPDTHQYASPPNFAGKSTFVFSWPGQLGWTYQVYRALDETLFTVDAQVRSVAPAVGTNGRFRSANDRDAFVDLYPQALQANLRDLIVDPLELDRPAIEGHPNVDTLLQALASLPMSEGAFTRLELDDKHLGSDPTAGQSLCIDDTLDGRSHGRYVYRLRGIGPGGNVSGLGPATAPVYVRGVAVLTAPVWGASYARSTDIRLSWKGSAGPVWAYDIYRAEDPVALLDSSHMEDTSPGGVQKILATAYAALQVELAHVRFRPPDGVNVVLGVFGLAEFDKDAVPLSAQPGQNHLDLNDPSDGHNIAVVDLADGDAVAVVYRNKNGEETSATEQAGVYAFNDERQITPGVTYHYRIRPRAKAEDFDSVEASVSELLTLTARVVLDPPVPAVELLNDGRPRISWPVLPRTSEVRVQRAATADRQWVTTSDWLPASDGQFTDDATTPGRSYRYRLMIRLAGRTAAPSPASDSVGVV